MTPISEMTLTQLTAYAAQLNDAHQVCSRRGVENPELAAMVDAVNDELAGRTPEPLPPVCGGAPEPARAKSKDEVEVERRRDRLGKALDAALRAGDKRLEAYIRNQLAWLPSLVMRACA